MNSTQSLLHSLIVNDKDKLVWSGSFDSLQQFVEEVLDLSDGKWSSPGGDAKLYESEDISIRWYAKSQTITVSGKDKDMIEEKLNTVASLSKRLAVANKYSVCVEDDPLDISVRSLNSQLQALTEKFTANLTAINCTLLEHSRELRERKNIELDSELSRLRKENMELKSDNECLTERVNNLSFILADLQGKAKFAEEEKASLITTIRLLNNDLGVSQPSNDDYPVKVNQPSDRPVGNQSNADIAEDCQQPRRECQSVPLQNRYSALNVEEADEGGSELIGNASTPNIQKPNNGEIVIIGDSIIKHIDPKKLTKKRVRKFTYPGKTADSIQMELDSIDIQSTPSHVIVHAGTNNVPLDSVDECAKKIENLIVKVKAKFPNSKIGLSGITLRQDIETASNVQAVNKKLKIMSAKQKVAFIDNSSINNTCLNGSRLHLNAKGSAFLATHFIEFLKGKQHSRPRQSHGEGFQLSTINQLGDLLKTILARTS